MIWTGMQLAFGVIAALVAIPLAIRFLLAVTRLGSWAFGMEPCGREGYDRDLICALRRGHFGMHATAPRQRENGSWYRVRFEGSRWSGVAISFGEDVDTPPKQAKGTE